MRAKIFWTTLLAFSAELVHTARFLAVFPNYGWSHNIWHYAIFQQLVERGHEGVVYGCFPPPSYVNITYVGVCGKNFTGRDWNYEQFISITKQTLFHDGAQAVWKNAVEKLENIFKNEKTQLLLRSNEKFDLVFVEALFGLESVVVFGHKFQAPVINLKAFSLWPVVNWMTGNSLSTAHIPNNRLAHGFTHRMSFFERMITFVSTVNELLVYHFVHLPQCEKLIQTYYNDPRTPPLTDMLRDISLTLVNSHQTLEYPRPYSPNIVPIGGSHLSYHTDHLPQDIKMFLDEAIEGVIFFSLRSAVPAHHLPKEKIEVLLKSFRKLAQKILWKIDLENLPSLPKNVMLTKWVSQPSVLAHPNCLLFITHGGLFSQHEALHHGVPVIGVPFFADQRYNVGFYEHLGVGVKLEFDTITEDLIDAAIATVLGNTSYKESAKRISAIVRDKPVAPEHLAVFWVEYVLRHCGAPHLRPLSAYLPWFQLILLDVLAAVLFIILASLCLLYLLVKVIKSLYSSEN